MSQSQIHVDPEKLRSFASELKHFTDTVNHSVNTLKNNVSHLGESWRDDEFEKFKREFDSVQRYLTKFVEEAKNTTPQLERDANNIEEYLKLKL